MSQLAALINIRLMIILVVGVMIILLLVSTASALSDDVVASEATISAQDPTVLKHKLFLDENSADFDDGLDAVEYEHSQKAKEIANANAKLAKLKASVNGGAK